jgi:hypothetical protein
MSTEEDVFLAGVLLAMLVAVLVFVLVYPPMRKLLSVNGYLRPACSFYGRTFFLVIFLAAWGPILSHGMPPRASPSPSSEAKPSSESATPAPAAPASTAPAAAAPAASTATAPAAPAATSAPAPAASAAPAAPEATATEAAGAFMNAVWHVAGALKDVCTSVGIFLALYVVLMTIVYAVLGRFRDPAEGEAARS